MEEFCVTKSAEKMEKLYSLALDLTGLFKLGLNRVMCKTQF